MTLNLDTVGTVFGPERCSYDADDAILYALAVGTDPEELQFLYEKNLKVLPTFAVVATRGCTFDPLELMNADGRKVLHGENRIELFHALPPRADLEARLSIQGIYDKGSGALAVVELEASDTSGTRLFKNTTSIFIRGEGGFGGDRGKTGRKNEPPEREPDQVVVMKTNENQAMLYRLCGDKNPLHIDPEFAEQSGFHKPILHGLCTYGYVGRAVLGACCDNDPSRMRALEGRFSDVVFPGNEIHVRMWNEAGERVVIQAATGDGRVVLRNAAAELN